jgi:hypothetical protein
MRYPGALVFMGETVSLEAGRQKIQDFHNAPEFSSQVFIAEQEWLGSVSCHGAKPGPYFAELCETLFDGQAEDSESDLATLF